MKKFVIPVAVLLAVVFLVYGSYGDKEADKSTATASDKIDWVTFDQGLKIAGEDGKYVLAYFWRNG